VLDFLAPAKTATASTSGGGGGGGGGGDGGGGALLFLIFFFSRKIQQAAAESSSVAGNWPASCNLLENDLAAKLKLDQNCTEILRK
jgi:hypothetical protein